MIRIVSNFTVMLTVAALIFLAASNALFGKDQILQKLIDESVSLRKEAQDSNLGPAVQKRLVEFRKKLQEWIELHLPHSRNALEEEFPEMHAKMIGELKHAGIVAIEKDEERYGFIKYLEFKRIPEIPDGLTIIAGITVPCGIDDSAYIYRFNENARLLILEDHAIGEYGETIWGTYFSPIDTNGTRLLLMTRGGVQCASCWNMLTYSLYKIDSYFNTAEIIFLHKQHSIYECEGYHVRLQANELLIEFKDNCIDARITRTHVLRYRIGSDRIERVDPVALQPQDFVDEWIALPWSEMESRSFIRNQKTLKRWHQLFHGVHMGGEFNLVQECKQRPDYWQICFCLYDSPPEKLQGLSCIYFLVHQKGKYEYEMEDISSIKQKGCPGNGYPSNETPSFFKSQKYEDATNYR